jgi:hypothetical protein
MIFSNSGPDISIYSYRIRSEPKTYQNLKRGVQQIFLWQCVPTLCYKRRLLTFYGEKCLRRKLLVSQRSTFHLNTIQIRNYDCGHEYT